MKILFNSYAHKDFYLSMQKDCKVWDCYHRAFFYCIGISEDTRKNIDQLFDFNEDQINPDGLYKGWQTSGSIAVCRLAFNLWNGFYEDDNPSCYTPENIFCCNYAKWFWQAIRVRYSEYVPEESYIVKDSENNIIAECNTKFMAEQYKTVLQKNYNSELVVDIAEDIILDIDS